MKSRVIFTVVRDFGNVKSVKEAKGEAGMLSDEAGEYLYGGSNGEEKIGFELQVSKDGRKWETVEKMEPE